MALNDKLINYEDISTFHSNLINDSSVSEKATWSSSKVSSEFSRLDASLANKADKTYVDASLANKADKTYVDASLANKANTSYVDTNFCKLIICTQQEYTNLQVKDPSTLYIISDVQ